MVKFLPCPLPCHSSDQSHPSDSSSSSSSSSSNSISLTSQPSLPSLPSLTLDPSPTTAAAAVRHHCSATLKSHTSYIFSLAATGKRLFSGSSDGEIRVWDQKPYPHPPQNHVVSEGCSAVKSIVVLHDDRLVTAHHDHKIRVWRIQNNRYKLIATLPTVNDRCLKLFSAKNYVEIRRHKKCTWVHHVDTVSSLALSNDKRLLYSVSWDRTIKVWRTRDFKCVESIQNAHDDAINDVVLSDGGLIFTGSADKSIKVWKLTDDKKKHALVATLEKHKSAINALALSSDGSFLYSGACDRSIIVWERDSGGGWGVVGALRGHKKAILCLGVVADLLCSGSADKTVRVWRRGSCGNSYSCVAVLEGHKSPVKCLTATLCYNKSGDGGLGKSFVVYSGSLDFDIKVWEIFLNFVIRVC